MKRILRVIIWSILLIESAKTALSWKDVRVSLSELDRAKAELLKGYVHKPISVFPEETRKFQ